MPLTFTEAQYAAMLPMYQSEREQAELLLVALRKQIGGLCAQGRSRTAAGTPLEVLEKRVQLLVDYHVEIRKAELALTRAWELHEQLRATMLDARPQGVAAELQKRRRATMLDARARGRKKAPHGRPSVVPPRTRRAPRPRKRTRAGRRAGR